MQRSGHGNQYKCANQPARGDTDYTEQLSNIQEQLSEGLLPCASTNDDTFHTEYNGIDD